MVMDSKALLKQGERLDDLQIDGLKIIQNPNWFCFGIDAVLISAFAEVRKNGIVADLGTGTGIIPLLLSQKNKTTHIHGFEIQSEVAEMAKRSVLLNGLEHRITIHPVDMDQASLLLGKGSCDVVVSNPPYMEVTEGMHNLVPQKAISRHELTMQLDRLFQTAHDLLKPGGSLYMIHRPSRMVDILVTARQSRMEPKELQFVHPTAEKKPNLMLLRFSKHGRRELKLLDPIVVYDDFGQYTQQLYRIYQSAQLTSFEKNLEDIK